MEQTRQEEYARSAEINKIVKHIFLNIVRRASKIDGSFSLIKTTRSLGGHKNNHSTLIRFTKLEIIPIYALKFHPKNYVEN